MRILVATDQWAPEAVGGSARVATATARALADRGHEVVVLAPEVRTRPVVERADGLELRREVRRGLVPQTFGDPLFTRRAAMRLQQRFDVLVAHQATNAVGLSRARLGAPLAYVFHASVPLEQRFMRPRLPIDRRLASLALSPAFALLERHALASAESILVLSEFSRSLLVEHHPDTRDRIVHVGGGLDLSSIPSTADGRDAARAELGLTDDTKLVITVRRLDPRMGLEALLRAAALLRDDGLRFVLAIAGDGVLRDGLRRLSDDLGLAAHVRLLGRISDDELARLYAAADLFVLPTVAYEGFGIATLEALASGVPVAGTPVGATPELLGPLDARLLAAGTDPPSLAAAVRRALDLTDDAFRAVCARYARETYDWRTVSAAWEAALERLVSR